MDLVGFGFLVLGMVVFLIGVTRGDRRSLRRHIFTVSQSIFVNKIFLIFLGLLLVSFGFSKEQIIEVINLVLGLG